MAPSSAVVYIHSKSLITAADQLPANVGRASLVHNLIHALGLLQEDGEEEEEEGDGPREERKRALVVTSEPATRKQLEKFHDPKFLDAMTGEPSSPSSDNEDDSDSSSSDAPVPNFNLRNPTSPPPQPSPRKRRQLEFGLEDDCPIFPLLPSYVREVAGASIQAARELRDGRARVAVSWNGGRHHCKRGSASGFCYVQDVALAILELRLPPILSSSSSSSPTPTPSRINRILYLDLDLHHGDGVESAFYSSASILTLSIHLHSPGFFPATGSIDDIGPQGPAQHHALNLALESGLSTPTLLRVFKSCIMPIYEIYRPDAVVVQCGCDGLAGDPCKEWNLDLEGMGKVLKAVLGWGKRTLVLGGGGYDLDQPLPLTQPIPTSTESMEESFETFAPSFTLDVPAGEMRDRNTEETLQKVESAFEGYANELRRKYNVAD
ncbi:Arginase/deacetylase [Meredithblackwellia eburnea MCA 4105]